MLNSEIKAVGKLNVVLRDNDGNVKESFDVENLVVTSGLGFIVSRMKDTTATAMSHMAIGSGTSAAAAGNTALGTELGRVTLTSTTVNSNTIVYVAAFGAGVGTGAVTEAGVFNAGSAGTMLCRTVFAVVNKAALDSMQITWTITLTAA
jgi:hypothetical protein